MKDGDEVASSSGPVPRWFLVGIGLAAAGSALAMIGTLGLSLLRFGVYTNPGFCPGGACVTVGPQYYPYIPTLLIVVVLVAALAPLVAILLPRFWWAGVACSLGGVGVPGGVWLVSSLSPPYPIQPLVLILLSELLLAGAGLTAAGLWLLRPRRIVIPSTPFPVPASNGTS